MKLKTAMKLSNSTAKVMKFLKKINFIVLGLVTQNKQNKSE
jgi:hypothetical protein